MKRKVILLLTVFAVMLLLVLGTIYIGSYKDKQGKDTNNEDKLKIVTSFYPTNILVKNTLKDIENAEVSCLTEAQTGCLHDYQLTTGDMKKIANADIFVINGGGMESYIEEILSSYPDLYIIDLSEGIELISNIEYMEREIEDGHVHDEGDHEDDLHDEIEHGETDYEDDLHDEDDHEDNLHDEIGHDEAEDDEDEHVENLHEEEHDHDHGEYNAHVFTDPALYMLQIDNFAERMSQYIDKNSLQEVMQERLNTNVEEYKNKLTELNVKLDELKEQIKGHKAIIFHDAFLYTAIRLGLDVVSFVDMESDAGLSSGEIANVIDTIGDEDVKILMIEKQFENSIAERIANETGANVYVIDTCVTGDGSLDSYIDAMYHNIEVLQEAYR